jgi:hypothetical protein
VCAQIALALKECLNHGLLHAYPVLYEKAGELTAQIKGTVLLMPSGSDPVTKAPQQVCVWGGGGGRPVGQSVQSGEDRYRCTALLWS